MRHLKNVRTLFSVSLLACFVVGLVECRNFYYPSYGIQPRRPPLAFHQHQQQPFQNYYLPPPPPPPREWTECAKIWNQFGSTIHFGLNQEIGPLESYNFIPVALEMRERCVLVMVDTMGKINVHYSSTLLRGEKCWIYPISYAHCESCLGKIPQLSENPNTTCAILYDSPLCSTTLGYASEAVEGEEEARLDPELYKKVSSLVVKNGCEMEIFDMEGFQGNEAIVNGTIDMLPPDWDNRIVSFKCKCGGASSTTQVPVITTSLSVSITTSENPVSSSASSSTTVLTTPSVSITTSENPVSSSTTPNVSLSSTTPMPIITTPSSTPSPTPSTTPSTTTTDEEWVLVPGPVSTSSEPSSSSTSTTTENQFYIY